MALGELAFISLFQMRVYTYLNIFVSKRRATGLYFIIPVAYMLMISIAYAIAAFILPPKTGFMYMPETNVCFTNDPVYFAGMGLIILQAVLLGGLLLKTLKMECCFNERRNAILGFIICVICGIVMLALGRIHFSNDKLALSGILKIIFAVVPQQGYFYLNLGPTIYHMVTHADEYNQRFIGIIEEKGLAHVYELACKSPLGAISSMRVNEEGKPRDINMAEADNGSEYSDSSNFSGNVPGPEHANQSQPPTYSGVRRSGSVSGHYT
ncbi:hypothetical protein H4217_009157 [Coemansia sp. RSA 1939]|nr:hypothetical protein H4217_009157 [Coemansia sp. RSA 1939]